MPIIKQEIYDDNGLIEIRDIEIPESNIAHIIADKEEQLLAIYEELKALKGE